MRVPMIATKINECNTRLESDDEGDVTDAELCVVKKGDEGLKTVVADPVCVLPTVALPFAETEVVLPSKSSDITDEGFPPIPSQM